ncbi:MAG: hypothetical protein ACOX9R_05820 [Armatimonadota bacterium]|jgi:hypothetical protein
MMRASIALVALAVMASAGAAQTEISREQLGREVKLTILVDKVMQPVNEWVTEEWMVREAAEAGFNVFSPRRGYEDLDAVRQVTQWCAKYGIYHLPWMRGSLAAQPGPETQGRLLLWANGQEQPLWSPNSDEFWEWTTQYVLEYARISAEDPHLMGVFLDYENYAPRPKPGNLYDLSYDDLILGRFAQARGLELPELAPEARRPWLEQQGLHEAFESFQVEHWRERCRTLREQVDALDPSFQFCIYPAPGTPFMVRACYPEWATEAAPIILADASTYGRPSRLRAQEEGLQINRQRLIDRRQVAVEAGVPFIYTGGIDPAVTGADPEFSGKNAVGITSVTDGYWVFYEGPTYDTTHPEYFRWFTWANRQIAEGDLEAWRGPREEPEDLGLTLFGSAGLATLVPPAATGERIEFPQVKLRRENLLVLGCAAGQPAEVVLNNLQVGQREEPMVWELRDPQSRRIASGRSDLNEGVTVAFTPEVGGVYTLGASSGSNAWAVESATVPVGIWAGEPLSLFTANSGLHFHVPAGVEEFAIVATGVGGETVRLRVLGPDGAEAAQAQTTAAETSATVTVRPGAQAGAVWSLDATRADTGVLEDYSITLQPPIPTVLSLTPEQVFGAQAR